MTRDRIELALADGRRISTPLSFYPTLARATPEQRRKWDYIAFGTALEWPAFDLQLSVESIAAGRREHLPPPGWDERTDAELKRLGLTRWPPGGPPALLSRRNRP